MAGKTISMTDFKQAILLKKQGFSNREIARQLKISRDTVNEKFVYIKAKGILPPLSLHLSLNIPSSLLQLSHPCLIRTPSPSCAVPIRRLCNTFAQFVFNFNKV